MLVSHAHLISFHLFIKDISSVGNLSWIVALYVMEFATCPLIIIRMLATSLLYRTLGSHPYMTYLNSSPHLFPSPLGEAVPVLGTEGKRCSTNFISILHIFCKLHHLFFAHHHHSGWFNSFVMLHIHICLLLAYSCKFHIPIVFICSLSAKLTQKVDS